MEKFSNKIPKLSQFSVSISENDETSEILVWVLQYQLVETEEIIFKINHYWNCKVSDAVEKIVFEFKWLLFYLNEISEIILEFFSLLRWFSFHE